MISVLKKTILVANVSLVFNANYLKVTVRLSHKKCICNFGNKCLVSSVIAAKNRRPAIFDENQFFGDLFNRLCLVTWLDSTVHKFVA